jgi:hypothetical protein
VNSQEEKLRIHSNNLWVVVVVAVCLSLTASKQEPTTGTNEAANATRAAAKDAYLYGYPLVLMDMIRAKATNVPSPSGTDAPMGQFASVRAFPGWVQADSTERVGQALYSAEGRAG